MRLKTAIVLVVLALCAHTACAGDKVYRLIPNASVVGHGALSYAFWDVYDATLYAPQGQWRADRPFALSIQYHCSIDGKDIADRSVEEMRRQGFADEVKLAIWNGQMKSIFPDVKDGQILSAVYFPGRQTTFYKDDVAIGSIKGDDFARLFFGIWLSEKTSEPGLRRALLGML